MTYNVELSPTAKSEVDEAYGWMREHIPAYAESWRAELDRRLASLTTYPERFPLAPEADSFEREVRQMLVGRRRMIYRVLYEIRGSTVVILYVRHSARDFAKPEEADS